MKDYKISIEALQKMPPGRPLRVEEGVKDMAGKEHTAVVWLHSSGPGGMVSKAHFDIETGEYLGETW